MKTKQKKDESKLYDFDYESKEEKKLKAKRKKAVKKSASKEAKKEANLALKACSNYNVSVIYYDLEYSDYQGSLSNEMYYKIAKSFCDEIEKAGYGN